MERPLIFLFSLRAMVDFSKKNLFKLKLEKLTTSVLLVKRSMVVVSDGVKSRLIFILRSMESRVIFMKFLFLHELSLIKRESLMIRKVRMKKPFWMKNQKSLFPKKLVKNHHLRNHLRILRNHL